MGGLMSFKSSHTAASAALETMNAGREVDRGSHRPRPTDSHGRHVHLLHGIPVATPRFLHVR